MISVENLGLTEVKRNYENEKWIWGLQGTVVSRKWHCSYLVAPKLTSTVPLTVDLKLISTLKI